MIELDLGFVVVWNQSKRMLLSRPFPFIRWYGTGMRYVKNKIKRECAPSRLLTCDKFEILNDYLTPFSRKEPQRTLKRWERAQTNTKNDGGRKH